MDVRELCLRTEKCFADLANKVALLLWENLPGERGSSRVDAHRFPGLAQSLGRVLESRIGPCRICGDPRSCDAWARTGGGSSAPAQAATLCNDHDRRLWAEYRAELTDLLDELENETVEFLSRHDPNRTAFHPALRDKVRDAVTVAAKPYLNQHLACSCCENVREGS